MALCSLILASLAASPVVEARAATEIEPESSVVVRLTEAEVAPAVAEDVGADTPGDVPVDDALAVALEVTPDELADLRDDPRVTDVLTRGTRVTSALARSVPLVGAPTLWGDGHTGAGKVIVVIDTGVDADFGGTLVGQACFAASGAPVGGGLIGHCGPDADAEQAFGPTCFSLGVCDAGNPYYVPDPAAGRPCPDPPASTPSSCAHGSAVAAVAARYTVPQGVAPDAGVYAIRVFNPSGTSADLIDIYLALDHVVQLADAGMEVAAVNLSVATPERFAGPCDADQWLGAPPAYAALLGELSERGIAVVAASGNDGAAGGIAFPACLSRAVAVGATDLADRVAPFSNTGPTIDLLAPGTGGGSGSAATLDIPSGTGFSQWAGTSFSAPHVAGAFALLEDQYPKASVAQLVSFLRDTGVPVARDTSTFKRMALKSPANALKGGLLFPSTAPIAGSTRVAAGDFDADGHDDVLAHVPGGGVDRISYGATDWSLVVTDRAVAGTFTPLVGNFRGSSTSGDDILWYAPGAAADRLWIGQANRSFGSVRATVAGSYTPLVGDFDGDGWDDIFWFASGPATDVLWYGGAASFSPRPVDVNGPSRAAVGDFDGDGRDDILFHGPGAAADLLWRGRSTKGTFLTSSLSLLGSYSLVVGNFDGDDYDDVVLYQPGAAADTWWRGGLAVGSPGAAGGFSSRSISVSGTFSPVVGDLDADRSDDIVWYAPGAGADIIWLGRASGFSPRSIAISGTYRPLTGDLDDNGGDELVMMSGTVVSTPVWWAYQGRA